MVKLEKIDFSFKFFSLGLILVGIAIAVMLQLSQVFAVKEFGISYTEIGLLGVLRSLPYIVSAFIVGFLLTHVNKKYAFSLSAILIALSNTMIALANDMSLVYISQFVMSLGISFYWPVAQSILVDISSGENRLRDYGRYSASWGAGFLTGSIVGGIAGEYLGLRNMFILSAILSLLALPFILKLVTQKGGDTIPHFSFKYFTKLASPYTITLLIISVFASVIVMIPAYAWRIGIMIINIGLMFIPMWILRIIASVYLSLKPPKRVKFTIVLISSLISSSLLLNALIPTYTSLIILFTAVGVSISYFYAVMFYIISKTASKYPEIAIGGFESTIGIGFLLGPSFSGVMADIFGMQTTFIALAMISISAGLIGILSFRRKI